MAPFVLHVQVSAPVCHNHTRPESVSVTPSYCSAEVLHEAHQTPLMLLPLGLNQRSKLVHLIVQTPHIPHSDCPNSSNTETLLFPS